MNEDTRTLVGPKRFTSANIVRIILKRRPGMGAFLFFRGWSGHIQPLSFRSFIAKLIFELND